MVRECRNKHSIRHRAGRVRLRGTCQRMTTYPPGRPGYTSAPPSGQPTPAGKVTMAQSAASRIPAILKTHEKELLAEWMRRQLAALTLRSDLLKEADLREQSRTFLNLLQEASQKSSLDDIGGSGWAQVRDLLRRPVAVAGAGRLLTRRDGDLRVVAQAAALRSTAQRVQERRGRARRGVVAGVGPARQPGPAYDRVVSARAAKSSSRASSASCWSCRLPW